MFAKSPHWLMLAAPRRGASRRVPVPRLKPGVSNTAHLRGAPLRWRDFPHIAIFSHIVIYARDYLSQPRNFVKNRPKNPGIL